MNELWHKLKENHAQSLSILSLFNDPERFGGFSVEVDDLLLDFSKTNIDRDARALLLELARASDVESWRERMFNGDKINLTEDRAVLHTALRSDETAPLIVDGRDVRLEIRETLDRLEQFSEGVRSGAISVSDGRQITDVVNIGIGGSDLGPAMACQALAPFCDGPQVHFVSNVDSAHVADTLRPLDPRSTLLVIASKTFTTIETMTNADTALKWLRNAVGGNAPEHMAAVSTALDRTREMGIAEDRVFGFADWVGGRYSLWGPVGLALMLAIGPERFRAFLSGGCAMDSHFRTAPLKSNLPVLMALVGIWHRSICGYPTRAVVPYDQRLSRLPAYLQQLDMESNGKRISITGELLLHKSGPVVWGEPGTNGQHAVFQLLHQGTDVIPVEFLIAACNHEPELQNHHDLLKANCLAQSEALMRGRTFAQAMDIARQLGFEGDQQKAQAAHRTFPGNRPSMTLAYPKFTPFSLGQIIALYEHRVFVEGLIWGINSFDQWGVELGKELANSLLPMVRGAATAGKDGSTSGLLNKLRGHHMNKYEETHEI